MTAIQAIQVTGEPAPTRPGLHRARRPIPG